MTTKLLKLALVGMLLAATLAACAPAPATAEPTEAMTEAPTEVMTEAPTEVVTEAATEAPAFEGTTLEADCSTDGSGSEINKVEATDANTVVFTLCRPDPAFREKVAFTSFEIESPTFIQEGDILNGAVGTGPYKLDAWNKGESVNFVRNDDYWGEAAKTETLVFRWSTEAAARLLELQAGTVDGIDNVGPEDFETVKADPDLQLLEREALNVFYIGFTVDDTNQDQPFAKQEVRQAIAKGIDRQRIVDNFYPAGSEVADFFTPCAIANGCVGDKWYDFDAAAAKQELADAGYPNGFKTKIYYRDVVRGYLPNVNQVAQDIQAQLKTNLNIDATLQVVESGEFIGTVSAGGYTDGLHLLGWGADYPQITNFLDYHFSRNQPQFGTPHPEIYEALEKGAQIADPADAEADYTEANNAIKEIVPLIPVAHGGSGVAYRADVENAQASPLGNENFSVMTPGDRTQFVWMQGAEPISLYCGDESDGESLRACEQVMEPLLTYEVGGTAVVPALAESCDPNDDLTVWTCKLRTGVKFHDGTDFDANAVVFNYSVLIDASNPLHKGNTGEFNYAATLFGLMNVPPSTN